MRYRLFLPIMTFIFLAFPLAFSTTPGSAQGGTCCSADWKLPLPEGKWIITQGDKDSCVSSHCAPTWVVNEYALDLVSGSEKDIKTLGATVLAPADGTVIDEFWDGYGGGNVMKIEHGDGGPVTLYMHLQAEYLVEKKTRVKQGDPVAKIGNSGTSTGAHLHVMVLKSKTGVKTGLKISSWDGNTNFSTRASINSTNRFGSIIVTQPVPPITLETPSLDQPGNSSSWPQSMEINLTWNSVPNANRYKVELWGEPYGTMTPCDWQSGTSCRVGTMHPGTFSWHIRARNSSGQESEWSDTRTFTIQGPTQTPPSTATKTNTPQPQAPGVPSLRDPANKSNHTQSKDVWFAWNSVSNSDRYYLEYWGEPYGTLNSGWINDVAYHVGNMWPGTYQWHVKSRGQNGVESNWSDTWTFTVIQPTQTLAPSTNIPPTSVPPTAIPPTSVPPTSVPPTAIPQNPTPVPQAGFIVLVDDLRLSTESGAWPPEAGQKLIAHIKIKNGGDLPIHVQHIGVRGRRNGSESWDIGFWSIDINGHDLWEFNPNNERQLASGNYSFRISYSLDGSSWIEAGNEINFRVP
jgi:hypothetical protein